MELSTKMAALLSHRAFLWISTISSAFPNLQFCIMSLMALNHWKRRRQKIQLLLRLKEMTKRWEVIRVGPNSGVKPIGCHDKFHPIAKQNVIGSARIACLRCNFGS